MHAALILALYALLALLEMPLTLTAARMA